MKKTNDTRFFFILLSNGDTIYFSVEKQDEIYKIYCEDYVKAFNHNDKGITQIGHSIEFTKNNFILKDNSNTIICNLKEDYNKIRGISNNQERPEIEMLYIDSDIRPKLLERGQMLCDESAYNIPGILYEPVQEQSTGYSRTKRPNNR